MKKYLISAIAVTAAALMSVAAYAETIELRMAHGSPRGHPNFEHANMLAEAIKEASNGRIEITVFGDRQLGDDRDIIQLVAAGTVDMGYASGVNFPLILDKVAFDALQLPGLVADYEHLARALQSEPANKMLDSLAQDGLQGLCFSDGGQRHFLNRGGPITSIEDFRGLKTRIVPIALHKEIWERAGTNPVGVPYGEVYTALQTRVIDAVEFNVSSIYADKVWENANHLTLTGHYFWPGLFFMNKELFDSWPADLQDSVLQTCRDLSPSFVMHTKSEEDRQIEALKQSGVEFYEFGDRQRLLELMEPIYAEWSERDPLIGEFIDAARELE